MNKLFFRRHRRAGLLSGSLPVLVVGAMVLLFLLLLRMVFPGTLTALATPLWTGAAHLASAVGMGNTAAPGESANDVARIVAQDAEIARLTAKTEDLMRLLGTRTEMPEGIVAGVLARPPAAPYDILIVDQGSEEGVLIGATAYGQGGTPLGTVNEVSARSARIVLYSTRGVTRTAWAGANRSPVELTGTGSGAFSVKTLRSTSVVVGDSVYLAASGAVPIGTIVSIDTDPSSPDVLVHIRPYVNPFSIPWVTIARDVRPSS